MFSMVMFVLKILDRFRNLFFAVFSRTGSPFRYKGGLVGWSFCFGFGQFQTHVVDISPFIFLNVYNCAHSILWLDQHGDAGIFGPEGQKGGYPRKNVVSRFD